MPVVGIKHFPFERGVSAMCSWSPPDAVNPVSPETSIRPLWGMTMFSRGGPINSRISVDPC
jgi:hypothetical protein